MDLVVRFLCLLEVCGGTAGAGAGSDGGANGIVNEEEEEVEEEIEECTYAQILSVLSTTRHVCLEIKLLPLRPLCFLVLVRMLFDVYLRRPGVRRNERW